MTTTSRLLVLAALAFAVAPLAGCLDFGTSSDAKAATSTGPTGGDAAITAPASAPDFRLACYRVGGHTALLPSTYVSGTGSKFASSASDGRSLVCYTSRDHVGLAELFANTSWDSSVLRIDADGRATYLDRHGEFANAEPYQFETKTAAPGSDHGVVKVELHNATMTQGDVWKAGSVEVAKHVQSIEVLSLTFWVPEGYDTTP